MNKKSRIEKITNIIILIISVVLGFAIATWTTGIQSQFFAQMGVSKWGAITVEPLLVLTSFILGIKSNGLHKTIAFFFMTLLLIVSMLTMVSMYTKKSFVAIRTSQVNVEISKSSDKTEELIRDSLKSLNERQASSKSTLKMVDKLQKQQDKTEKRKEGDMLELQAIIETLSTVLHVNQKVAVLLFSIFISLASVFSPSFLFFSAGMMIRSTGAFTAISDQIKRMQGLSLKQRIILLSKENVTDDIEELAKFLGTSERVIKGQLSRIGKKIKFDDKKIIKEETDKPKKRKRRKRKNIDIQTEEADFSMHPVKS